MQNGRDPFAIKEIGGDIKDRTIGGYLARQEEGASLGNDSLASLRRVISYAAPKVAAYFILVVGLVMSARVIWLQGIKGEYWRAVAEGNRIRLEISSAQRGLIVDRNGQILVRNSPSFSIIVVPADLPKDENERQVVLNDILALVPAELVSAPELKKLSQVSYLPQVVASGIPHDLAMRLMAILNQRKGVRIEPVTQRDYVAGPADTHMMGYVGFLSPEEYEAKKDEYQYNDNIGKAGLELSYEKYLRGVAGYKQVEVDARGQERKIYATQKPIPGDKLVLSIDQDLQNIFYDSLQAVLKNTNRGGSAIALDPTNGAVLALVSYPSFDGNIFTSKHDNKEINRILNDAARPMYFRPIAGEYPPGSTIKPFYAAAGLKEGVITTKTTVLSTGGLYLGKQFFADWKAGGHGVVDVYKAIAESVNTFFYLLGGGREGQTGLGVSGLTKYLNAFGFGQDLLIDVPGSRNGFVPSLASKLKETGERWYRGDTYNLSIGQGNLLVTPMQLAAAYGALATDGTEYEPRVVDKIIKPDNETITTQSKVVRKFDLSPEILQAIQKGMRQTVVAGSARSLGIVSMPVSGKTGTAQTGIGNRTHAWFAGYAPSDKPRIVVVVMVEQGGEGSSISVPIAKKAFEWYASTLNK